MNMKDAKMVISIINLFLFNCNHQFYFSEIEKEKQPLFGYFGMNTASIHLYCGSFWNILFKNIVYFLKL